MSLRKLLFLNKLVRCRISILRPDKFIRNKIWILSSTTVRFNSYKNVGNKYKNGNEFVNTKKILGQIIQEEKVNTEEVPEVKKKPEHFESGSYSENEKSWRRMKIGYAVFSGATAVIGVCLVAKVGAPKRSKDGEIIEDEFINLPVVTQYLQRTWKGLSLYLKNMKEPSRLKLLPDPLPAPYQPTYTLVIELTDTLVQPEWSYQTGWRFKKRPGVDAFLKTVANYNYEIVIFTAESAWSIYPVIDQLDPDYQFIAYRLFRDSTHFKNGVHVKNLDGLNRDLSKVILVDWNKQACMFNPENSLIIKKWKGADDDTVLSDLANFLEAIAMLHVQDVREVLTYYSQFEDPIAAFRDNQQRLMQQTAEQKLMPKMDQTLTSQWIRSLTRP